MADIPILILFAFLALPLAIAALGAYLGKRENNSTYTGLMLFLSAGLWIIVFLSTDNIIIGYTEERSILTNTITISGEGTNSTIIHMNSTGALSDTKLDMSACGTLNRYCFAGEEVLSGSSLIGDSINKVSINLKKVGVPTGTAYIGVWSSSVTPTNSNYLYLVDTISVNTLTTSYVNTEVTRGDISITHTLTSGQVVGIFYSSGDLSNYIVAGTCNSCFDSTNSAFSRYDSAWRDFANDDLSGTIKLFSIIQATDGQTVNTHDTVGNRPIIYDFTQELKYMFLVIAAMTSLIAATTVSTGRSSGGFKPFDKL